MVVDGDKWYTQRGARLRGPYSRLTIHRYLLLGRIKNSDRVSKDGEMWEPITQVPELIPEELLDLNSDLGWKNFLSARDRVDERKRNEIDDSRADRRDERNEESALTRMRGDWIGALNSDLKKERKINLLPVSLFGLTLAVVILIFVFNSGPV